MGRTDSEERTLGCSQSPHTAPHCWRRERRDREGHLQSEEWLCRARSGWPRMHDVPWEVPADSNRERMGNTHTQAAHTAIC